MLAPDLIQDVREFLDGRNDDLLAAFDELPQVAGVFGMADGRADLEKVS